MLTRVTCHHFSSCAQCALMNNQGSFYRDARNADQFLSESVDIFILYIKQTRVDDTDGEQGMRLCDNPFRSHLVCGTEKLVFTILDANTGHISLL